MTKTKDSETISTNNNEGKYMRFKVGNTRNWEEIYEAILRDIVLVVEDSSKGADRKIDQITEMLVGNDFMEQPLLYG